jgi:hypothetical protein
MSVATLFMTYWTFLGFVGDEENALLRGPGKITVRRARFWEE